MKDCRSDNSIQTLAASLFVSEHDGRVKLGYPFLFICCLVGLLVSISYKCVRGIKHD